MPQIRLLLTFTFFALSACAPRDQHVQNLNERLENGEVIEFSRYGERPSTCPQYFNDSTSIFVSDRASIPYIYVNGKTSIISAGLVPYTCYRIGSKVDIDRYNKAAGQVRIKKVKLFKLKHLRQLMLSRKVVERHFSHYEFSDSRIEETINNLNLRMQQVKNPNGVAYIVEFEYVRGSSKAEAAAVRSMYFRTRQHKKQFRETFRKGEMVSSCKKLNRYQLGNKTLLKSVDDPWKELALYTQFDRDLHRIRKNQKRTIISPLNFSCYRQGDLVPLVQYPAKNGEKVKEYGYVKITKVKKMHIEDLLPIDVIPQPTPSQFKSVRAQLQRKTQGSSKRKTSIVVLNIKYVGCNPSTQDCPKFDRQHWNEYEQSDRDGDTVGFCKRTHKEFALYNKFKSSLPGIRSGDLNTHVITKGKSCLAQGSIVSLTQYPSRRGETSEQYGLVKIVKLKTMNAEDLQPYDIQPWHPLRDFSTLKKNLILKSQKESYTDDRGKLTTIQFEYLGCNPKSQNCPSPNKVDKLKPRKHPYLETNPKEGRTTLGGSKCRYTWKELALYNDISRIEDIRHGRYQTHLKNFSLDCLREGSFVPITRRPNKANQPRQEEFGWVKITKVKKMNVHDLQPADLLHSKHIKNFEAFKQQWVQKTSNPKDIRDKHVLVVIQFKYIGCRTDKGQNCGIYTQRNVERLFPKAYQEAYHPTQDLSVKTHLLPGCSYAWRELAMYKDLPHSLPYIRSKQKHFHIVGLGFNCLEVGRKVPLTRTPKKEAPLEVEYGFVRTLKVMRMNPVDLRPSDLLRHNLSNDEFKALRAQWIERQKFTHKAKDKNRIVVIWFQYEGCNAATQNCDQVATPAPGSPL